jgi:apolipoprotein N-acyltransferase
VTMPLVKGLQGNLKMKKLLSRSTSRTCLPLILSGLLLSLSYPSYPYVRLEVLAWVWMVPLLLSLKEVKSFPRFLGRVYLTMLITSIIGMSWLMMSTVLGTFLLFFVGAGIFTMPFVAFYFIRQTFGWRVALWSAPLVWTAWDWLYLQSEGSIGWLAMGVTQSNLYWLVQYIDITGMWGITFWLVLFNVLVVMAVEGGQFSVFSFRLSVEPLLKTQNSKFKTAISRLAFVACLMLVVPLCYSVYVFVKAARTSEGADREISVLLVQPNINPWEKLTEQSRPAVLRKTINLTNKALAELETKPDLIIWPETAVPYVLAEQKDVRETVYRGITRWETPLLTGLFAMGDAEGSKTSASEDKQQKRGFFNGAALLSPKSQEAGKRFNVESSPVYHKRVLMPFIERVPYVDRFPALQRLAIDFGAGDGISRGREAIVFPLRTQQGDETKLAAAICYEYLYPAEMAELVRNGAQMVALITNEGWFSRTHGEYQMAAFSRLRSIETRRAMARTANTGMTWLLDKYGRVYQQSPWWSEQTLPGKVALSDEISLYVRYTDYLPKTCAWLTLTLLVLALVRWMWLALPLPVRLVRANSIRFLLIIVTVIFACSINSLAQTAKAYGPGDTSIADTVRFLEQSTWGPTEAEVQRVRKLGLRAFLNEQFAAPASGYPELPFPPDEQKQDCAAGSAPDCARDNYTMYPLQRKFFTNALTGRDQLRQRVAFALHQIFVVSGRSVPRPSALTPYLRILDRHAFGNFRTLLQEITLSPAMGEFLDLRRSTAESPNENFAREVLQLFSIGTVELNLNDTAKLDNKGRPIPTYTQETVVNFTRAFSGWTLAPELGKDVSNYRDPMVPRGGVAHDTNTKTLLRGMVIPACPKGQTNEQCAHSDLKTALENVFSHPNVAPFISKQLIQHLVTSNPSPAYIERIARTFNNDCDSFYPEGCTKTRGNLKAVVTAILLDPEARGDSKADPNYGRLREPVQYITNLLRAFNVRSFDKNSVSDGVIGIGAPADFPDMMEQPLFLPATVFGYYLPDYEVPGAKLSGPAFQLLSASASLQRANFANLMIYTGIPLTPTSTDRPAGTSLDLSCFEVLAPEPERLVESLNGLLLHGAMSEEMRQEITNAVSSIAITSANFARRRAQMAAYLVITSPQYEVQK